MAFFLGLEAVGRERKDWLLMFSLAFLRAWASMVSLREVMVLSSGLMSQTSSSSNKWRRGRMRMATSMLRVACFYLVLSI